jgi:hypothetical protein
VLLREAARAVVADAQHVYRNAGYVDAHGLPREAAARLSAGRPEARGQPKASHKRSLAARMPQVAPL